MDRRVTSGELNDAVGLLDRGCLDGSMGGENLSGVNCENVRRENYAEQRNSFHESCSFHGGIIVVGAISIRFGLLQNTYHILQSGVRSRTKPSPQNNFNPRVADRPHIPGRLFCVSCFPQSWPDF